jgi:hypothetical protein
VTILKSDQKIDLGLNVETVENATPGPVYSYMDLDFQKILKADTSMMMRDLAAQERSRIVPLINRENVVTVVQLTRADEGWKIMSLVDKKITQDLNVIQKTLQRKVEDMVIFDIPNLQGTIYQVGLREDLVYFTDYSEKFSMRDGVKSTDLIPLLREDALRFQREYGDLLKDEDLLR